jgi:hypothetical protein
MASRKVSDCPRIIVQCVPHMYADYACTALPYRIHLGRCQTVGVLAAIYDPCRIKMSEKPERCRDTQIGKDTEVFRQEYTGIQVGTHRYAGIQRYLDRNTQVSR